jgi:phosphate transport system ATP-binding protein
MSTNAVNVAVQRPHVATANDVVPDPVDVAPVFRARDVDVLYSGKPAVRGVTMDIAPRQITALIGPSGCGKTTFLRCLNRMNDLIPGAKVEGEILYAGDNLYDPKLDVIDIRRRIGMVFQKPNPFPKSIYENVAFGARVNGLKKGLDDRVEHALKRAAVWDEVKDKLKSDALALSGGQQQRLCIARCIAIDPEVILMDEPASALDPISTLKIEDLMRDLKHEFTIVIVTHNMQQAARVSDRTAFMSVSQLDGGRERHGMLVEYDRTEKIFTNPSDERTEQYVTGRFG